MRFNHHRGVTYLTFDIFPKNVVQAIFTRRGGLSPAPWESLNMGGTVGDQTERVRNNRFRAFDSVGCDRESIYDVWQVHSPDIVIVNSAHPRQNYPPELKADGMLTDNPGISLFMRFADCTPVFLYDRRKKVIGIVHAGWQGTVKQAVGQAVRMMKAAYASKPGDIVAAIGPSIGPDHYEIGADVVEQVQYAFSQDTAKLIYERSGKMFFDLWAANILVLNREGVTEIESAQLCTACHPEDWYSHRAQKGRTGRFGALIGLASLSER